MNLCILVPCIMIACTASPQEQKEEVLTAVQGAAVQEAAVQGVRENEVAGPSPGNYEPLDPNSMHYESVYSKSSGAKEEELTAVQGLQFRGCCSGGCCSWSCCSGGQGE